MPESNVHVSLSLVSVLLMILVGLTVNNPSNVALLTPLTSPIVLNQWTAAVTVLVTSTSPIVSVSLAVSFSSVSVKAAQSASPVATVIVGASFVPIRVTSICLVISLPC